MNIISNLHNIWHNSEHPFLIHKDKEIYFNQIINERPIDLSNINKGDVVSIIGDFTPQTILTLLQLIEIGAIIVPLTPETSHDHEYFFNESLTDKIIKDGIIHQRHHNKKSELINELRDKKHPGLILFSTGTTGRPKAILHDFNLFIQKFNTRRPSLRTISFLLFDHIGGINTLFHTLFNKGVIITPKARTVESILDACNTYKAEVLPTTPTFLRMMLISGLIPDRIPNSLKLITYGTERMDQPTLNELCSLLPNIDFRQTFGMSELGIVRVKSKNRNSLFMRIGGDGIETKIKNGTLFIKSKSRMLGYLNAASPFDEDGWYNTKDIVEEKDGYIKIIGRESDVINVGGLKFVASEVERVALSYPNVSFAKAFPKQNPITGQHVELIVQPQKKELIDKNLLKAFLNEHLQPHMTPKRIHIEDIKIGHRFKKI